MAKTIFVFMRQIRIKLLFFLPAISLVFVFGLSAAAETPADSAGDVPAVEETAAVAPELMIAPAMDDPFPGTAYNAGDRQKLFLAVEFFASSSEEVLIDRLSVILTNSIMSRVLNPGITGDNIENIILVDDDGKETAPEPATADGKIVFSGLGLAVPAQGAAIVYIYADVAAKIVKEVSARTGLAGPDTIGARGADSGLAAAISGAAPGNYIALSPAVPKPDLIVSGVEFTQESGQYDLVAGEDTYINVTYKNIGTGPALKDFDKKIYFTDADAFVFDNDGLPVLSDRLFTLGQSELGPGQECIEIYGGRFAMASATVLKIEIDPSDTVDEIDDRNNIFSYDIKAAADLSFPDFVVYDLAVTPASPRVGENVTIEVTYKNLGGDFGREKGDFITKAYFGYIEGWFIFDEAYPMETSRPYPTALNPLRTGGTITEKFRGYFRRAKEMTLEAAVDPTDRVTELNENNNKLTKTIVVREQGASGLWGRLAGRIVLRVEKNGEAYYLNPRLETVSFLGRPADAFAVMRREGVGITDADLRKVPVGIISENMGVDADGDGLADTLEDALGTDAEAADSDGDGLTDAEELERGSDPADGSGVGLITNYSFVEKSKGKIYLAVERNGEAWYVNPADGRRYFLGRPADAFAVMRALGLGISENDYARIK